METGDRIRMVERMREENGEGPLLSVRNLVKSFPVKHGILARTKGEIRAVNDVSFDIAKGDTLSLVGESGCGKTTTGRSILRLIEPTSGTINFSGHDVRRLGVAGLREVRREMQIIFQDPVSSLNPRMTVGAAIREGITIHRLAEGAAADAIVQRLLEEVGLRGEYATRYPHEFSGGQRQRIGIARALAMQPELLVADEPVSALDVSVQAQVLGLFAQVRAQFQLAMVFITHDLRVAGQMCDRIAVMQRGEVVEYGETHKVLNDPQHAYTRKLIDAVPRLAGQADVSAKVA